MKKLIFTLPLIFATFTVHGQNCDRFTGSLLWKITGNGLESPCYIFGTHHMAEVSFAQNYPGFSDALESAVQVIGEIDMSEMAVAQSTMMMHAVLPAGTTYESLLSAKEVKTLDELLKTYLMAGIDQYGQYKPAMISNILAIRLMAESMPGFNPLGHVSIDQYVQNAAQENGKKVIGLETALDQIQALFYSEPLDKQAKDLFCALANMEHGRESVLKLNKAYAEGNLYEAYQMTFDDNENPCQTSEEWAQGINRNRNDRWMEQLPGIFADGPSFVAVGMLHLCGEEGLLYRLDQLGYTVEAVK